MEWDFEKACAYLEEIPRFTKKHGLDHTKAFAACLDTGSLEGKVIHVAGTNGKGSVCSYLNAILNRDGYHTVLFTSPHLVRMTERFQIDGREIDRELFVKAFEQILLLCRRMEEEKNLSHPTFFEFLFLMLLWICQKSEPDYVILETGLGGRLDATNIFEKPALCVITKIGLDHMQYLGDDVLQIAAEKAGILKRSVELILQSSDERSDALILQKAKELDVSVTVVDRLRDEEISPPDGVGKLPKKSIDFSYQSHYYSIVLSLDTIAAYQIVNVKTAIAAYEVLTKKKENRLDPEDLQEAVFKHKWPGRMEEIKEGLIVDGAHNEDGMESFLQSVAGDGYEKNRTLILAFSADKDVDGMLKSIAKADLFTRYYATAYQAGRSLGADELKDLMAKEGLMAKACENAGEAIGLADKERAATEPIYIAGSLYLVGEVKTLFE